jgi:hypothetical protein
LTYIVRSRFVRKLLNESYRFSPQRQPAPLFGRLRRRTEPIVRTAVTSVRSGKGAGHETDRDSKGAARSLNQH